jgi:hypothetical protein
MSTYDHDIDLLCNLSTDDEEFAQAISDLMSDDDFIGMPSVATDISGWQPEVDFDDAMSGDRSIDDTEHVASVVTDISGGQPEVDLDDAISDDRSIDDTEQSVETDSSGGQLSPRVASRSRKRVDIVLSEEVLQSDISYADDILKIKIHVLHELNESDIFSSENIHFQANKKVQNLFDLCEPNLQSLRTTSRYKCTIREGGEVRKQMIHFYYNALVNYQKHGCVKIESPRHREILEGLYSTKVRRENMMEGVLLTSCNFVDRMILTLGFLWRRRTQNGMEQEQEQSADEMKSFSEDDTQSECSSESRFSTSGHMFAHREAASCAPTVCASVADVEGLRRSGMQQSEQIDELAHDVSSMRLELDEVKQGIAEIAGSRSDGARKKSRGAPVAVGAPVTDVAQEITGQEVLDILEGSSEPINALQVRDAWLQRLGHTKNTVPAEFTSAKVYNRVLTQLHKEGRVFRHEVSSGKPFWSIAKQRTV